MVFVVLCSKMVTDLILLVYRDKASCGVIIVGSS